MSNWPYRHAEGHMVARIVEETADNVTIVFQHIRLSDWRGQVTLSKDQFRNQYALGDAA